MKDLLIHLKNLVKLKNQKENSLTLLKIFYYYVVLYIEIMIEKISMANSHLPQLIGFVLMSIGYTLGNKFYLPEIKQK